ISASDTPKSKLETSSFPPVSTPAPAPKPLSKRSCCHFSGSCFAPLPRPRPPPARPPPPRWLRFSLIMSSRDISILSPMMAAPSGSRGLHFRPRYTGDRISTPWSAPPTETELVYLHLLAFILCFYLYFLVFLSFP
uniref:Uncharacterized protein n=1 Tax=Podarcis muralis TaxID=64176 RepID=A0A670IAA9_PODMU